MIKILTIIGARPQIIKAAAISRAIQSSFSDQIQEIILHTGQHYDHNMSEVFIKEMQIPTPDFNLEVGSESHGVQTAKMIQGVEAVLDEIKPDYLILYGDTNSTLAGAIAGSKLHVPVVHIEAGLRSFTKTMPEEINRIVCDHASTLLFSPTLTGYNNLIREGFNPDNDPPYTIDNPKIYHCGDIMYDNSIYFTDIAKRKSKILEKLDVIPGNYILGTIHRDHNTDNPEKLSSIFKSIIRLTNEFTIPAILPLHPRTKKLLKKNLDKNTYDEVIKNKNIVIIDAVSFLDMIELEKNSKLIMTDSGGVQKESYFYEKPCIILRPQTEWKEIVEQGTGIVTDTSEKLIYNAYKKLSNKKFAEFLPIFGDGHASEFICHEIISNHGIV